MKIIILGFSLFLSLSLNAQKLSSEERKSVMLKSALVKQTNESSLERRKQIIDLYKNTKDAQVQRKYTDTRFTLYFLELDSVVSEYFLLNDLIDSLSDKVEYSENKKDDSLVTKKDAEKILNGINKFDLSINELNNKYTNIVEITTVKMPIVDVHELIPRDQVLDFNSLYELYFGDNDKINILSVLAILNSRLTINQESMMKKTASMIGATLRRY